MKGKMEGDTKKKCNEENYNHPSPLRITSQGKGDSEPNDSQTGGIKSRKKDGDIMNDKEEGHSDDKSKAIEDGFELNNSENILMQILKNKDMLLDEKDKRLEDKNKLLENQSEFMESQDKLLKRHDNLLKIKDKLIESQDAMIQSMDQLLKDKDKVLGKYTTGKDGIEDIAGRKSTLKRGKAKHVENAGGESNVDKTEFLEKRIMLLEAGLKTVLDKITKDKTSKDKPQNMQPSDVQLMDGNLKNLDLNGAFARLSANAIFTRSTTSEEPYLAAIANLQDEIRYFESRQCRKSEP